MAISANTFSNFGAGVFFANEASAALLGCEFRLYIAEPARTQFKNAIDDLFNLFGRVLGRFHIKPNAAGRAGSAGELTTQEVAHRPPLTY